MASSVRIGQFRVDGNYYDLYIGQGNPSQLGSITFFNSNANTYGYKGKIASNNTDGCTHFYHESNASTFTDIGYWDQNGMYITYFGFYSDIRLKNVIETNPAITMEGIDVIKYTLKSNPDLIRYGYSAQQVQGILPDLITINAPINGTEEEGILMLNYSDLHVLKIAALEKKVQDLQSQIDALKA
jgi:hypothetical protein